MYTQPCRIDWVLEEGGETGYKMCGLVSFSLDLNQKTTTCVIMGSPFRGLHHHGDDFVANVGKVTKVGTWPTRQPT